MSDTLTLETSFPLGDTCPQQFAEDDVLRKWTIDIAKEALRHIHPDCDYPDSGKSKYEFWRNIASALMTAFGKDNPETRALFIEWSSGRLKGITSREYKSEKIQEQYDSFDISSVSMGTVEFWARKGGWNPNAGLLERLEKAAVDPSRADELIAEVAAANLSAIDLEKAVLHLHKITGLGKTILKAALKEQQKSSGNSPGRVSAASVLVKLGRECELWQSTDPKPELFATVDRGKRLEHLRLGSGYFRQYLVHRFNETTKETPSSEAVSQALAVLKGYAQEKGQRHQAWLRIAKTDSAIYFDLADEDGNVIEITPDGWRAVTRPPVRLIRGMGRAIPMPVRGGRIEDLCQLIGVDPEKPIDKMKVAAWCVAALRPGFPFTILILLGEQGSGKSTKLKMLKALIDPAMAAGRGLPRKEDDLVVSAGNNHIITADNLSSMSEEIANALCRLSTGGGNAKRKLYEDGDEFVIEAMRPIILNGINIPSERQDLLDRALIIDLPSIAKDQRKTEGELWAWFEAKRSALLGVLLDGVVAGLRGEAALRKQLKVLPRMADFACFAAAAMGAWGWKGQTFLRGYEEAREEAAAEAAKTDVVLTTVRDWVQRPKVQTFEGTSEDLLEILSVFLQKELDTKGWKVEHRWPTSPNHLSKRLRSGAVGLRALGVGYEKFGNTKLKLIRLWSGGQKPVFAGTDMDAARRNELMADAVEGAKW